MHKSKVVGLSSFTNNTREELTSYWIRIQTNKLAEYAKEEIEILGSRISAYNGAHHMDRTGNLLNSLCWIVTYNGKIQRSGYYREEMYHSSGLFRTSSSYLHEFFYNDMEEVNGRAMAQNFTKSYKGRNKGWSVVFAILAPYWGYWESGFVMKSGGGNSPIPKSTRFMQFQVMTHIFDDVRMALKPAETHLTVYVPKYSWKNPKYKKKRGYKRIGVLR